MTIDEARAALEAAQHYQPPATKPVAASDVLARLEQQLRPQEHLITTNNLPDRVTGNNDPGALNYQRVLDELQRGRNYDDAATVAELIDMVRDCLQLIRRYDGALTKL